MSTVEEQGLSLDEFAQRLRSVDARVRLIPARILRRVIRGALGLRGFGRHIPHRGGYSTTSAEALRHATRDELGFLADETIPQNLILLAQPSTEDLYFKREEVFIRLWRELFHARVHLAFEERIDLNRAEGDGYVSRIEQMGRFEFAEVRAVLYEDDYLVLPADDPTTFKEFAAVYLEQHAFHPDLLPHTFPSIDDHDSVRKMLSSDVNSDALFDATRPPGAPQRPPTLLEESFEDEIRTDDDREATADSAGENRPDSGRWVRLQRKAEAASERGNNVRAAILRTQAARIAPPMEKPRTKSEARSELDKLARRLRVAIGFDAEEAGTWRHTLPIFLERASVGLWPREARLLYDLQKVCSDQERAIYAIDLRGWVLSLGRRPVKRLLPDHREILVLSHLRTALTRLRRIRGPEPARGRLESLVEHAIDLKESQIRERFRERIRDVLDRVNLRPTNLPERAARRKMVEELLDLIVERGYLRIGDLRDSISRSQIKLRDLSGFREFLKGDPLLRADADLARSFDGVYHRGEIYLRALQRVSSLAFGTKIGRLLTKIVAIPFGGAFIALEGLQHIVGPLIHLLFGMTLHLMNPLSFVTLGLLVMGIINVPRFRATFFGLCRVLGRVLRVIFYEVPAWVLDRSLIRMIAKSAVVLLTWDWVVKPLGVFYVLYLAIPPLSRHDTTGHTLDALTFLAITLFFNSRQGRVVEEIAADGASRVGQRIWRDVLPSIFRSIMEFFKAFLEMVERVIYTVDEWLRFRSGENRLTFAGKAVIGLGWFAVAYVARIYLTLLIEPQINPIKHFPVVTVSHKIILPMSVTIYRVIHTPLRPLGEGLASTIAGTTVFLIPGLFGFLVWELKENWRLYAANRSTTLRPLVIGHHGETMSRLLRRGFHSGTVPKLYEKLRRRDREAREGAGLGPSHKVEKAIHHVEEAIRDFIDRGVLYLLEESRSMGRSRPFTGEIKCSTNRVVVELCHSEFPDSPAKFAFEESERRLHVRLIESGWIVRLDQGARRAISSALAGLYAMSDVELVHVPTGSNPTVIPTPMVTWSNWVKAWEGDAAGLGHDPIVTEELSLLPAGIESSGTKLSMPL